MLMWKMHSKKEKHCPSISPSIHHSVSTVFHWCYCCYYNFHIPQKMHLSKIYPIKHFTLCLFEVPESCSNLKQGSLVMSLVFFLGGGGGDLDMKVSKLTYVIPHWILRSTRDTPNILSNVLHATIDCNEPYKRISVRIRKKNANTRL